MFRKSDQLRRVRVRRTSDSVLSGFFRLFAYPVILSEVVVRQANDNLVERPRER
jgi:hypothetical protein